MPVDPRGGGAPRRSRVIQAASVGPRQIPPSHEGCAAGSSVCWRPPALSQIPTSWIAAFRTVLSVAMCHSIQARLENGHPNNLSSDERSADRRPRRRSSRQLLGDDSGVAAVVASEPWKMSLVNCGFGQPTVGIVT
jgi:hypothetical protein